MIATSPAFRPTYPGNHLRGASSTLAATAFETVDTISLRTVFGHDDVPEISKKSRVGLSRTRFTQEFIATLREQIGEGKLTFLASPKTRVQQSYNVAESFRLDPENGVVVDPGELSVAGWSAEDYRQHWSEVLGALAKDTQVILGPGWRRSKRCQGLAKLATELGVNLKKVELGDLDRASIRMRLEESEQELERRGFQRPHFAELLDGAVDQNYLADQATGDFVSDGSFQDPVGYVGAVVARTLNGRDQSDNDGAKRAGKLSQPEFTHLYVQQARQQLKGQPMTYVSTPITGGRKKYDLFESLGIREKSEMKADDKKRFVNDVILGNTFRAFHIAESLREEAGFKAVMDPSEITIPEWSQAHYAAHWDEVVRHLASKVVLAPGWDYSSGCILELKRALDKGIPIQEIRVTEVRPSEI